MKIFSTLDAMTAAILSAGQNVKINGDVTLLDGGNAEYYIQTLADYGGVAPVSTSPDKSTANGNVAVKMASESFPQGGIIMWTGSVPPDGWSICDGFNGTPDLRGRFILASTTGTDIGDTGGSSDITLPANTNSTTLTNAQVPVFPPLTMLWDASSQGDNHYYTDVLCRARQTSGTTGATTAITASYGGGAGHSHSITGLAAGANNPPYYILAFIMRTGLINQVLNTTPPEGSRDYLNVSGVVQLDANFGQYTVFNVLPNGNITDLKLINAPQAADTAYAASIKVTSDGASTVTFNPSFNWQNNVQPAAATVAGHWDWYVALTVDNGITYDANISISDLD